MENIVLLTVGRLQGELQKKVIQLRKQSKEEWSNEERMKERVQLKKRLNSARENLHAAVDKAIYIIQEKAQHYTDPFSHLGDEIEEMSKRLRNYRSVWEEKDADLGEQGQAVEEIGKI